MRATFSSDPALLEIIGPTLREIHVGVSAKERNSVAKVGVRFYAAVIADLTFGTAKTPSAELASMPIIYLTFSMG